MNNEGKDNAQKKKFSEIPAKACILEAGEFALGDNGDGAKSAPVRLVARSGKAIEHWFWGRVVHDLAGMHLHKQRIPIDYVHDPKEVIGYLNRFETQTGDLIVQGALVPFKESDRATEIIHKEKLGVPYEASINFGGDGIRIQEIEQGEVTEVNGAVFEGPGIVIREWPLRGVAIAPYGADANTESSVLSGNNAKTYTAAVVSAPEAQTEDNASMSEKQTSVDVGAEVEAPEAGAVELTQAVDAESTEAKPEEAPEAVEPGAVEEPKAEAEEEKSEPSAEAAPAAESNKELSQMTREEFAQIADEFGNDVAAQTMKDGGNYESALKLAYDGVKVELDKLKAQFSQTGTNGTPVPVSEAKDKKNSKLFNSGK
jgi:hypothetical protein